MGSKKRQKMSKQEVAIPKNWLKKCDGSFCEGTPCIVNSAKSYHWCAQWIKRLTAEQKVKLNCGHAPTKLSPQQMGQVHYYCHLVYKNRPADKQACVRSKAFVWQLHKVYSCQPAKRAANLDSDRSGKLAVGLSLGGLLLILLVAVFAYWYFWGRQKSGDRPPKGPSTKGSKGGSKGGKSKLGKSKLGSRKSSQRSSRKGSLKSKATKSAKKK